jgi:uncharacterized protein YhfF
VDDPSKYELWNRYLADHPNPKDARETFLGTFRIGGSEESADAGAKLILDGIKTTTSSLMLEWETSGDTPPFPGALSILLDGRNEAVAVVETKKTELIPFNKVDAAFAKAYGEWDRTLETWRAKNFAYYTELAKELGGTMTEDTELLCEWFEVVVR